MNTIPAAAQARASRAFSDRNPYPGCTASAPAATAAPHHRVHVQVAGGRGGPGPIRITWSASRAGSDPASASDTVSTVSMPSRRQVRITRTAISPRLATSTRRSTRRPLTPPPPHDAITARSAALAGRAAKIVDVWAHSGVPK